MKKNNFLIICLLLILVFSINASAFDIDEFKENFNQIKTEFEDREANFSIARNIKEAILYEILYIDDFFVNLESGLEDKSVENQLKTMSATFLDEVESYRNLPEGKTSPIKLFAIIVALSSLALFIAGTVQKNLHRSINRVNGQSIFDLSDNTYAMNHNFDIMNEQHLQMHMQAHNDALMQHMQMNNDMAMQQAMNEAMRSVTPFDHGGYVQGYGFNPSDTMAQDSFNQMNNMNNMF